MTGYDLATLLLLHYYYALSYLNDECIWNIENISLEYLLNPDKLEPNRSVVDLSVADVARLQEVKFRNNVECPKSCDQPYQHEQMRLFYL